MKEYFSRSGLLILISLLSASFAQANDELQSSVTVIEVNAAKEFVARDENAVILDVRTPIEYEESHIPGAVNVNVQDESFQDRVVAFDPNKIYIVHCTKNPAGGRSSRALETLKSLGFTHLYSLEGGYVAWKNAELPLTDSSN
jgi:rhodanese-related sulfurtransferase